MARFGKSWKSQAKPKYVEWKDGGKPARAERLPAYRGEPEAPGPGERFCVGELLVVIEDLMPECVGADHRHDLPYAVIRSRTWQYNSNKKPVVTCGHTVTYLGEVRVTEQVGRAVYRPLRYSFLVGSMRFITTTLAPF